MRHFPDCRRDLSVEVSRGILEVRWGWWRSLFRANRACQKPTPIFVSSRETIPFMMKSSSLYACFFVELFRKAFPSYVSTNPVSDAQEYSLLRHLVRLVVQTAVKQPPILLACNEQVLYIRVL